MFLQSEVSALPAGCLCRYLPRVRQWSCCLEHLKFSHVDHLRRDNVKKGQNLMTDRVATSTAHYSSKRSQPSRDKLT